MSRYYNRQGEPIGLMDFARLYEDDAALRVGGDDVSDLDGRNHFVSTVLLGLDHNWGGGPPLIFETMVFCKHDHPCDWSEEQYRYSTEEQAVEGHAATVERIRSVNSHPQPGDAA